VTKAAEAPSGLRTFAVVSAALAAAVAAVLAAAPQQASEAGSTESMKGRVVLITGSTDGLGREVAFRTGARGAGGDEVGREIESRGGSARFYAADLASLAQVRQLAEAVLRDYDRLDVLVNNAGIWINSGDRQVSADGHEMHFAVNYLSGFLLTRLLLPRIVESAPSGAS
jgi:NAD(P)-dependent dehydrogenase (short-subunit alcohol dehydrogenase family)